MLSRMSCAAIAVLVAIPTIATAQPRDQRTYFTFSQPVELPGTTLPAGTYLFRLADSSSNRHIVQVLNEDGSEMETTLMAIPARRVEPSDEPEVRFMETSASSPAAISTWWYPGRTTGHEFVWPRDRAVELASASKGRVLSVPEDTDWTSGAPPEDADLTRIGPDGSDTEVTETAEAAEPRGRAQEGRMAASERAARQPAPTTRTETETAEPRRTLPATAGVLPLIGLIGLGSLSAGLLMSRRRARR